MQVKICGITSVEQGCAIAQLGATALGYICVKKSPRYITPQNITPIVTAVSDEWPEVQHFGVFANDSLLSILNIVRAAGLTTVQLHGDETPATCHLLRDAFKESGLPKVKLVKALRIQSAEDLETAGSYEPYVDSLLLDAYHPEQLGGTGETIDWRSLQKFSPGRPWFLAGGLTPANVQTALTQISPDGIDLSSGVERSPGDKDLEKVRELFEQIKPLAS